MTLDRFLKCMESATRADEGSIDASTKLREIAGFDSMGIVALIAAVDEEFDIALGASSIVSAATVGDLADLVRRASGENK
jgi:acyl carrier protein